MICAAREIIDLELMPKRQDPMKVLIFSQFIYSALSLIFGLFSIYASVSLGFLDVNRFLPGILFISLSLVIFWSILGFVSGYGLLKRKCWAWYTTFVLNILSVLSSISSLLTFFEKAAEYSSTNTPFQGGSFTLIPLVIQVVLSFTILQNLLAVMRQYRTAKNPTHRRRRLSR